MGVRVGVSVGVAVSVGRGVAVCVGVFVKVDVKDGVGGITVGAERVGNWQLIMIRSENSNGNSF